MSDFFLNGPAGRLEARFDKSTNPTAPCVIVLHPNPQLGGTMNNKVVYAMHQAFVSAGFSVLRFNFRGVGKSGGLFDGDPNNELADSLAALDWLKSQTPDAISCWVAGYSSGALSAFQLLMRRPDIGGFAAVSPPANVCDFSFLFPCPASGLVIQGKQDDIVPEESVAALAEKLNHSKRITVKYICLENADHLYTNQLKSLFDAIVEGSVELITAKIKRKKTK